MPVRIRLSRGGAKKRPFYRIVVADSRRSRDGKFIDQLGTYNPMLAKDNPERVKLDADKAKDWIAKGAQPSDRVKIFLSNINLIDKPVITEKTKKHLPKKKAKEEKPAEEKPKVEAAEAKTLKRVYLSWAKKKGFIYVSGHVREGVSQRFSGAVQILKRFDNWHGSNKRFEYYRRPLVSRVQPEIPGQNPPFVEKI